MGHNASSSGRREFLQTSATAVAGTLAALTLPRGVHAAGSDVLKIGLVGCGSGLYFQKEAGNGLGLWFLGLIFLGAAYVERKEAQ